MVRCGWLLAALVPLLLVPGAASLAAAHSGQVAGASRGASGSTATGKPRSGPPSGSCLTGAFATCGGFVGPGPWAGEHQPPTGSGYQDTGHEQGTGR